MLLFSHRLPSGGIGTFGPLIIKGFGFDQVRARCIDDCVAVSLIYDNQFQTLLFNIPFAALQFILTILSSWIATRLKLKSPVVFCLTLPPIAGASALLVLGRGPQLRNTLLGCYYVVCYFRDVQ